MGNKARLVRTHGASEYDPGWMYPIHFAVWGDAANSNIISEPDTLLDRNQDTVRFVSFKSWLWSCTWKVAVKVGGNHRTAEGGLARQVFIVSNLSNARLGSRGRVLSALTKVE